MIMQKSIAKNSIYNIIYTIANIIFPFVTSIYVSRILLPAGVGKVASAQNIASYFVTIAALGLPSYGVREFAKVRDTQKEKDKLFTELIIINIISTSLAIISYFLLVYINHGFNGEWTLYGVCGLVIFFNYLNIDWMYNGLEEYGYITGRSLVVKGISFFVLLLFVKTKQDYVIYGLISSLATGGNYIFNVMHARKFVALNFNNIELKKHLKPVFLIACIIFLSSVYNKIDITMLNMMATNESVGYYTYAQKTINIVLTMANAVTAALLPRLSYYYENYKEGFFRLLDKGFQILCFIAFPLTIGMSLVASQAVEILYGNAFTPTALTIQLMCPLILIKGFGDLFCYQLVYSTKNEKIILPAAGFASLINLFINTLLIPILLQNGAVIASVFSELATNTIQFCYMKKKINFDISSKPLVKGVFSTLIMSLCVILIKQLHLSNIIGLLLEVISGIIVYVLVNLMIKNALLFEMIEKLKEKICLMRISIK